MANRSITGFLEGRYACQDLNGSIRRRTFGVLGSLSKPRHRRRIRIPCPKNYRIRHRIARMQPFLADSKELGQNCAQHRENDAQCTGIGTGGVSCRRIRTGGVGCVCGKTQCERKRKDEQ